jgi:excisionase family DNA binding protein
MYMTDQELLLKKEVAGLLNISVQTLDRIIMRGELKVIRIGVRIVRIHRDALNDYLRKAGK